MTPSRTSPDARARQRQRVAYEAARLLAADGSLDIGQAKLKAAGKLGLDDEALLPRNSEVEAELRAYQRLFRAEGQPRALRLRREAAAEAMVFFARFDPCLVGPVLAGTADEQSPVLLHLYSDGVEEVAHALADAGIPAQELTRRLVLDRGREAGFPAWAFLADGLPFELVVLPLALRRQAPLGSDGKPQPRANLAALRRLLDEDQRLDRST